MSNQIQTNYEVSNLEAFKKNILDTAIKTPRTSFKPILKFAKHGQWILGQDKDEVTLNAKVAVWAPSLLEGWIGWQNGKVVGEHMRPVSGENIELIEREPIDEITKSDGWAKQVSFEARFLDSDQLEVIYKASSDGGLDAFYDLVRKIGAQFGNSSEYINPVVQLSRTSYVHKEFGLIYKPEFKVVDWMSLTSPTLYSQADKPQLEIDPDNLL